MCTIITTQTDNLHKNTPTMASHCHFISNNFWLGTKRCATDNEFLNKHNITHILSVTTSLTDNQCATIKENITGEHRIVPIYDVPNEDLLSRIPECISFMDTINTTSYSGILVHCDEGVSRSASVVIAFIMYLFKVPVHDAITMLKGVRPIMDPNPGFVRQLHLFYDICWEINDMVEHPVYKGWRRECTVLQRYSSFVRSVMDVVIGKGDVIGQLMSVDVLKLMVNLPAICKNSNAYWSKSTVYADEGSHKLRLVAVIPNGCQLMVLNALSQVFEYTHDVTVTFANDFSQYGNKAGFDPTVTYEKGDDDMYKLDDIDDLFD